MTASLQLLELSGIGVPPYSARGLQQTLEPIAQSMRLRRTVNGELHDVSNPRMRKLASVITGSDQQPPALDATWPGRILTVDCAAALAVAGIVEEPTESTETADLFARPHVPGSVWHDGGFTFYRPRLVMRVVAWTVNRDPWGAVVDWSLTLEEM